MTKPESWTDTSKAILDQIAAALLAVRGVGYEQSASSWSPPATTRQLIGLPGCAV